MNYRVFYQNQIKQEIPHGFVVHHLDGNRNNNKITNLVAIPEQTHISYHTILQTIILDYGQVTPIKQFNWNLSSLGISSIARYQRHLILKIYNNIEKLQEIEQQILDYIELRNNQCGLTIYDELKDV